MLSESQDLQTKSRKIQSLFFSKNNLDVEVFLLVIIRSFCLSRFALGLRTISAN